MLTPRVSPSGTFVNRGVSLAWHATCPSEPTGSPVVLLHGAGEHAARYRHLVDRLTASGRPVFALDLRGHGRSGGDRAAVREFAEFTDDLQAFLTRVVRRHTDARPFLLGYSLGAAIAAHQAAAAPHHLAGVVLAAPAFGLGPGLSPLHVLAARVLGFLAPRLRLVSLDPERMTQDPQVVHDYRADPLNCRGRFGCRFVAESLSATLRLATVVEALELPLLILHGGDDQYSSPDGSRRGVGAARSVDKTLLVYPGTGHDLFHEPARDTVIDDLIGWLDRVERAARVRPDRP